MFYILNIKDVTVLLHSVGSACVSVLILLEGSPKRKKQFLVLSYSFIELTESTWLSFSTSRSTMGRNIHLNVSKNEVTTG